MAAPTPTPNLPPITFNLPNKQQPDTDLHVLNQIFRVHSSVLKMHAEYFRTLFDSAEKDQSAFPQGQGIRYTWLTHMETDGSWYLTLEHSPRDAEGSALVGDADEQVQAFATLLRAIYRMPIEIYSVKHLEIITELADYYRALPETSKAVTSSLLDSRAFTTTIPENCVKLLEVSRKLRNKKIGIFFQELLENVPSSHRESLQELAMTLLQTAPSYTYSVSQGDMARMNLPQYFRNLQKSLANKFAVSSQIKEGLKRLLHSELRLDQSGCFPGEAGIFASFFLCAVIKDSELPWDDNEMNW